MSEQNMQIPEDIMQAAREAFLRYAYAAEGEAALIAIENVRVGKMDDMPMLQLAAQAILAERQRDQWQPIETAPKDGTKFDVGTLSEWGFERVTDIWWSDKFKGWARWDDMGFERNGEVRLSFNPTHWMPLPAAPKGGDA